MINKIFTIILTILFLIPSPFAQGENKKTEKWGIISLGSVYLRRTPSHASEITTQALMGTPVKILEKSKNGWFHIQLPDGYECHVHPESIAIKSEKAMDKWKSSERYIYTTHQGFVYAKAEKGAMPISDMVIGCIVEKAGKAKGKYIPVKLPDGRKGFVHKKEVEKLSVWCQKEPNINKMLHTAKMMLGSAYFWGGTSIKGCDCSGLSKIVYYAGGIILRRDADMQAETGEPIPVGDYKKYRKGDLLFFGNDKEHITHVAIYIDNGKFIHSSGRVRYNSLNPDADDFYELSPVCVSRILTRLDTNGITTVKMHPWYFK